MHGAQRFRGPNVTLGGTEGREAPGSSTETILEGGTGLLSFVSFKFVHSSLGFGRKPRQNRPELPAELDAKSDAKCGRIRF